MFEVTQEFLGAKFTVNASAEIEDFTLEGG